LEILSRAVDMAPGSLVEASRTIEATFSSGAPVKRDTWLDGEYTEVLSMDPKAIRLDRMNRGAAFLDSHDYCGGTRAMLGTVVPNTVRVEGGKLVGQVKFSKSEEGERAFQDAKDGILRNLSVGYLVHKYEIDDTTTPPTRTVTDWEPHEISAVAIPADPKSQFRSLRAPQRELSARFEPYEHRLSAYSIPFGSFPTRLAT
jgi:HK97 family phage prohead protease